MCGYELIMGCTPIYVSYMLFGVLNIFSTLVPLQLAKKILCPILVAIAFTFVM